jgi:hypothetical protein
LTGRTVVFSISSASGVEWVDEDGNGVVDDEEKEEEVVVVGGAVVLVVVVVVVVESTVENGVVGSSGRAVDVGDDDAPHRPASAII